MTPGGADRHGARPSRLEVRLWREARLRNEVRLWYIIVSLQKDGDGVDTDGDADKDGDADDDHDADADRSDDSRKEELIT